MAPASSRGNASLLFFNGKLLLRGGSTADAAAVHAGRFLAIGSESSVRRRLARAGFSPQRGWRQIDLRGRWLIPGLIDAHMHPLFGAVFQEAGLALRDESGAFLNRPQAVAAVVRAAAAQRRTAAPDAREAAAWLAGYGWNPALARDPQFNSGLLDAVCPARPVFLLSLDAHFALVNSAGWRRLQPLKFPAGSGVIPLDAAGRPRGLLLETPQFVASLKVLAQMRPERVARAFEAFQQDALAAGLTAIADVIADPGVLRQYLRLYRQGRLKLRLFASPYGPMRVYEPMRRLLRLHKADPDRLGLGPEKYLLDGTPGNHNAAWFQAYADDPATSGYLTIDPAELEARVARAHRARRDLALHAAGDLSVHIALDAIERGWRAGKPAARIRIEHFDNINAADRRRLPQLARRGLVASIQPTHFAEVYCRIIRQVIGRERMRREYPLRSLLRAGIPVALNSDWPAAMTFKPLEVIAAALRHGRERLSPRQALDAYTRASAYALRRETSLGELAEGFHADAVLLSGNPLGQSPGRLRVLATMIAGELQYGEWH